MPTCHCSDRPASGIWSVVVPIERPVLHSRHQRPVLQCEIVPVTGEAAMCGPVLQCVDQWVPLDWLFGLLLVCQSQLCVLLMGVGYFLLTLDDKQHGFWWHGCDRGCHFSVWIAHDSKPR
jgi:hypothetical protein